MSSAPAHLPQPCPALAGGTCGHTAPLSLTDPALRDMALQRAVLLAGLLVEVASRSSGTAVRTCHVARGPFTRGLALPPLGTTLVPAAETLIVHPIELGPVPLGGQLTHGPTPSPCSSLPVRPSFPSAQLDLFLELKWSLHRAAHWHWPELVGWTEMPAPGSTRPGHDYQVSDTGVLSSGSWRCLATSTHLAARLQDGGPSYHQLCLSWVGWDRTAEPPFSGFPGPHGALHFLATLRLSLPITGRVLGNLGKHGAELPGTPSRGTPNHLVCE